MDAWEKLCYSACVVGIIIAILLSGILFQYAYFPKTFNGYYLCRDVNGSYAIYINWENAPDVVAYRSYDPKDILEVYERLKATEKTK